MVHDDVPVVISAQAVRLTATLIAYTKAQVAQDDVVSSHVHRMTCNADALSGSGLPGDGNAIIDYTQGTVEKDGACHVEHHSACSFLTDCIAKRTGLLAVDKCCDVIDPPATSSGRIASETFRTRKGGKSVRCRQVSCQGWQTKQESQERKTN